MKPAYAKILRISWGDQEGLIAVVDAETDQHVAEARTLNEACDQAPEYVVMGYEQAKAALGRRIAPY